MAAFQNQNLKFKGDIVWWKPDRPIDIRAPLGVLFGFKKFLGEWGYIKKAIELDEDKRIFSVARTKILKASTLNDEIKLEWLSEEWQNWEDLQAAAGFKDLLKKALAQLAAAKENSKGQGKGKKGH